MAPDKGPLFSQESYAITCSTHSRVSQERQLMEFGAEEGISGDTALLASWIRMCWIYVAPQILQLHCRRTRERHW